MPRRAAWRESSDAAVCRRSAAARATIDLILWETAQARYLEQSSALARHRRAGAARARRRCRRAPCSRRRSACSSAPTCRPCSSRSATCRTRIRNRRSTSGDLSGSDRAGAVRRHRPVPRSMSSARRAAAAAPPRPAAMNRRRVIAVGGDRRRRRCARLGADDRTRRASFASRCRRRTGGRAARSRPRRRAGAGGAAHQGHAVLRVGRRPQPGRRSSRKFRSPRAPWRRRARSSKRSSPRSPPAPLVIDDSARAPSCAALYVSDRNEAFVDLDATVRDKHPGGSMNELFTVYTIVNAITTNLPRRAERAAAHRRPRGGHAGRSCGLAASVAEE